MTSLKQGTIHFNIRKLRSCKQIPTEESKANSLPVSSNSKVTRSRSKTLSQGIVFKEISANKDILESQTAKEVKNKSKKSRGKENVCVPTSMELPVTPLKNRLLCDEPYVDLTRLNLSPPRSTLITPPEPIPHIYTTPKKESLKSPCKSPCKRLNILNNSPRRSPRKLNYGQSLDSDKENISTCKRIGVYKSSLQNYSRLRKALANSCSGNMIGREREMAELQSFITIHLREGTPGALYVSGAPGTGKTASILNILNYCDMSLVQNICLNCMTQKTSFDIFRAIASLLGILKNTERECIRAIEKKIVSSKSPILLILDEIDQLDSKNQNVLYTLFEWPALARSKLVLIGIANMLDLTDRILPRLQANESCRPKLLHFAPYTKAEIVNIIQGRIKKADLTPSPTPLLKPSAIQFVAGKVASVAGDVRKALDVCRRAVEVCEAKAKSQHTLTPGTVSSQICIDIPQVLKIFNEVYGSRVIQAVSEQPQSFPMQQKLLLCSLLLIHKHAKQKEVTVGKLHEVYSVVCRKRNLPPVDASEFASICFLMESRGLLQVKKNKEIRNSKVCLRLNESECELALGDSNLLAGVLSDRNSLGKIGKKM